MLESADELWNAVAHSKQTGPVQTPTFDNYSCLSGVSLDLQNEFELDSEREVFRLFEELEERLSSPNSTPLPPQDSTLVNDFNSYRLRGTDFRQRLSDVQFEEWSRFPHLRVRGQRLLGPATRPSSVCSNLSEVLVASPAPTTPLLTPLGPGYSLGLPLHSSFPLRPTSSAEPSFRRSVAPAQRNRLLIQGTALRLEQTNSAVDSPLGGTVEEVIEEDGDSAEEIFAVDPPAALPLGDSRVPLSGSARTLSPALASAGTAAWLYDSPVDSCFPPLPRSSAPRRAQRKRKTRQDLGLPPLTPETAMREELLHLLFCRLWNAAVVPAVEPLLRPESGQIDQRAINPERPVTRALTAPSSRLSKIRGGSPRDEEPQLQPGPSLSGRVTPPSVPPSAPVSPHSQKRNRRKKRKRKKGTGALSDTPTPLVDLAPPVLPPATPAIPTGKGLPPLAGQPKFGGSPSLPNGAPTERVGSALPSSNSRRSARRDREASLHPVVVPSPRPNLSGATNPDPLTPAVPKEAVQLPTISAQHRYGCHDWPVRAQTALPAKRSTQPHARAGVGVGVEMRGQQRVYL
eukprot:TRINITY_DN11443_c0_g1_i1.p1 TRINITY_DN11443_c0_g1~~TRINITY_DN11443_c0_g1_i1.p1  ORF type:complete len:572 (-),score=44.65 TRINITY_DN11443_c0_g1_i1:21-1736(-)